VNRQIADFLQLGQNSPGYARQAQEYENDYENNASSYDKAEDNRD
jgi:hypothetical protein